MKISPAASLSVVGFALSAASLLLHGVNADDDMGNMMLINSVPCNSTLECEAGSYCGTLGMCMKIGSCMNLPDCELADNEGYPMNLCEGSLECDNGLCEIDCDGDVNEEGAEMINVPCTSSSDCTGGQYCGNLGMCMAIGSCMNLPDCELPDNQGYPINTCEGSLECDDGTCQMDCSGETMDNDPCTTSSDCTGGQYCGNLGMCMAIGSCMNLPDCELPDNQGYPINTCEGSLECDDGTCQMDCSGETMDNDPCTTSSDCDDGEYCGNQGMCMAIGSCMDVPDCSADGNVGFPVNPCVGSMTCSSGSCIMDCTGEETAVTAQATGSDGSIAMSSPSIFPALVSILFAAAAL